MASIQQWAAKQIARKLAETVSAYMRDPAHRAEFEAYYLKKYGKPYVWKKGISNNV